MCLGANGKNCYFLVFVQLFEKYGTLIEIYTALIEKVSPCSTRRENMEGNVRAYEKQRRKLLKEIKAKDAELAELERLRADDQAALLQTVQERDATRDALYECELEVESLQSSAKRRAMDLSALTKSLAKEKAARATVEEKNGAQRDELNVYRVEAAEHAAALQAVTERQTKQERDAELKLAEVSAQLAAAESDLTEHRARAAISTAEFGCQNGTSFVNLSRSKLISNVKLGAKIPAPKPRQHGLVEALSDPVGESSAPSAEVISYFFVFVPTM
eukprot:SAG31_NODE_4551_length_3145_cov_1.682534_2_plen_274_part_00